MNAENSAEKDATPAESRPDQSPAGGDHTPDLESAAYLVEQAREQLRAAEACYRKLRSEAARKAEQVRGKTVGDLVDLVLSTAKKYPTASLFTAGVIGYLLGRLFRR